MNRRLALPVLDAMYPECTHDAIDETALLPTQVGFRKKYSFDYVQERLDELLKIHEYERERLGQELHDSTGQLVISLLLSLDRLRRNDPNEGQETMIDEIEQTVRQIEKEIRSLAFLHHQAELSDHSMSASLERLVHGFGRRTGLRMTFKSVGKTPAIEKSLSIALLRITQEALVNIYRHAHATSATVKLKNGSNRIQLQICDDGIGIGDSDKDMESVGIGLQGMRHRVETRGGLFEIDNLKPGLMICATIPLAI